MDGPGMFLFYGICSFPSFIHGFAQTPVFYINRYVQFVLTAMIPQNVRKWFSVLKIRH
jgi:hypothetical protein